MAMSARRVVLLAVLVLLAGAAACWWRLSSAPASTAPGAVLPWWVLLALFAVVELFVLHLQIRREAQSVSLSEVPLVLGLCFAPPAVLAVTRVAGALAVFVLHRRQAPLKLTYNAALLTAEVSVASVVWLQVRGAAQFPDLRAVLALYAACSAAALVGGVATQVVIGLVEGSLAVSDVVRELTRYTPLSTLVTMFGLVAAYALQHDPVSAVFLVGCGTVLFAGYRSYGRLSERHLSLERLYRFSQAVGASPESDAVLTEVLRQALELLHAEKAEIVLLSSAADDHDAARLTYDASGRLRRAQIRTEQVPAALRSAVVDEARTVLVRKGSRVPALQAYLDEHGHRDGIAVPLRGDSGVLGILLVHDRLGEVRSFDESDVLLLETVANHAAVALDNGRLVDRLRHDSLHDALTGLANRVKLQQDAAAALQLERPGEATAVMIMDLDGFKEVNDTLGHQCGDLVLVEVATRLTDAAGDRALVARLGGDEFAVLLATCPDAAYAEAFAARLMHALELPVRVHDMDVQVGASVGIALSPDHADEVTGLLVRADQAMYTAKSATGTVMVFSPELDGRDPQRLALTGELRGAIREGQLTVHVQPQALVATGEVVGVEALARWEHPTLGLVMPDEFIPAAERSGLIGQVTREVLGRALAAAGAWDRAGEPLRVAVNLSARTLLDPDLVDVVARTLTRHGVPASRLTLEITESSVMADPRRTLGVLENLRGLGVTLSVDDFGTGYSSLSYLKRLPVQEVKIDKSFVLALADNSEDLSIVRSIVDLGANLGLAVVAEGIENRQVWDLLAGMGCTIAQGYHLGRPMPVEDLLGWLHARREREAREVPVPVPVPAPRAAGNRRAAPHGRHQPSKVAGPGPRSDSGPGSGPDSGPDSGPGSGPDSGPDLGSGPDGHPR